PGQVSLPRGRRGPEVSMPKVSRVLIIVGALSLLVTTQLSALGFHALDLSAEKQRSWEWATELQAYHSLGLILLGILAERLPHSRLIPVSAGFMILGLFLFSGSIYLENLSGSEAIGQVAPMGG